MMKQNENREMLELNNGYILANYSIFLGTEMTEIVVVHIGKQMCYLIANWLPG